MIKKLQMRPGRQLKLYGWKGKKMIKFLKELFEIWKLEIEVRKLWKRCLIFRFHEYSYLQCKRVWELNQKEKDIPIIAEK